MLTWIKKRCRRNSAPSGISNKRLRNAIFPESPNSKAAFQFDLEDERPVNHSYEDIPEIVPCLTSKMATQVSSLTEQLLSGLAKDFDKCFICGKSSSPAQSLSKESLCSCYVEPLQVYENDYADVTPSLKKRALDDYDIPNVPYSCDDVSTYTSKRRRLFRSRSDIRKRPLPELPQHKSQEEDSVSDDVSDDSDSGEFYEKIDSYSEDSVIVGPYISAPVLV